MTNPEDLESFLKWFQGSKVVDEAGRPLVVYHSGYFDERVDPVPHIGPEGMHFGTYEAAEDRVVGKLVDDFIKDIRLEQDTNGRWHWSSIGDYSDMWTEEGFDTKEAARRDAVAHADSSYAEGLIDSGNPEDMPRITAAYLSIKNPKRVADQGGDWKRTVKKARMEGHDGLIYTNLHEDKGSTSYVAFQPSQVKSVHNKGEFGPNEPSVLGGPSCP